MSLAELFRKFPTPTYGSCGGAKKVCGIRKEELDPLDQLFFDHDDIRFAKTPEERKDYDVKLVEGVKNLTEEDFKKIPSFQFKWPFFKRAYARKYAKACEKLFI